MLGAARDDIFSAVGNVDFIDNFINDSGFIQGVVDKFEPVAKFMDGFVDHVENTAKENLSDTQIKILTDSVTAAWDQAKLGVNTVLNRSQRKKWCGRGELHCGYNKSTVRRARPSQISI